MGLSVKWDITYKCNLNCGHCINGHLLNNKAEELSLDEIKKIVDKLYELNKTEYIHLLGGEPTYRKDFFEICDYFELKKLPFGFNTNGLTLNSDGMKKILHNKSLQSIIISLEGPTAEINDTIRGKNVFNIVIKNLKELELYRKGNNLNHINFVVNTVVSKQNFQYILQMMDFCIELGVDELNLLQMIPDGNAEGKDFLLSQEEELELVVQIAKKYAQVKDKLVLKPKFARPIVSDYCEKCLGLEFPLVAHECGAGTEFAFINNQGILAPCDRYIDLIPNYNDLSIFNLTDKKFFQIWGEEIFSEPFKLTEGAEFYQKYEPCNKCSHLRKDCYPCIVYGLNKTKLTVKNCEKYINMISKKENII